jgi:pimeloyl-ACP methyl ester carboxylesterase
MQHVTRDGVTLAFEEAGAGEPAIVFVPGGSCDWWSFHEQLEHFSADHRCVSLDLRGHGASDKPRQAYTMGGYADDVAWVIGRLGLDRPVVVGHSMGGAVALQLVADHPGTVRALVLADPAPVTDNRAGFEQMLAAFERHGVDSTRRRVFRNFFLDGFDETLSSRSWSGPPRRPSTSSWARSRACASGTAPPSPVAAPCPCSTSPAPARPARRPPSPRPYRRS